MENVDIKKEIEVLATAISSGQRRAELFEYGEEIFYSFAHRDIYQILYDNQDREIDLPTFGSLLNEHKDGKKLEKVFDSIVTAHYCLDFAGSIDYLNRLRHKRTILEAAKDFQKKAINYDEFFTIIEDINSKIKITEISGFCDFQDFTKQAIDDIFVKSAFIRSGIPSLDEKIIGLFNGQLIIIASRPGCGKSTLALQIAKNINDGVLFFSGEMKRHELYSKIISADASIETWKIEAKKTSEEELQRLLQSHDKFCRELKMILYDSVLDINKIKSYIKQYVYQKNVRLVIIDYLQIISGAVGHNKHLEIQSITMSLKQIAHSLNIPIILLCQLNREGEKNNRHPRLSDLRDSGAIESDADVVIFLHEDKVKEEFYVIVAKNRKGRTGYISDEYDRPAIIFNKKYSRFECNNAAFIERLQASNPEYFHDI